MARRWRYRSAIRCVASSHSSTLPRVHTAALTSVHNARAAIIPVMASIIGAGVSNRGMSTLPHGAHPGPRQRALQSVSAS